MTENFEGNKEKIVTGSHLPFENDEQGKEILEEVSHLDDQTLLEKAIASEKTYSDFKKEYDSGDIMEFATLTRNVTIMELANRLNAKQQDELDLQIRKQEKAGKIVEGEYFLYNQCKNSGDERKTTQVLAHLIVQGILELPKE